MGSGTKNELTILKLGMLLFCSSSNADTAGVNAVESQCLTDYIVVSELIVICLIYYVSLHRKTNGKISSNLCNTRSMTGSGSLVDVAIPELSESPWPGIDIFCTSIGLGAADSEGIRPETDTGNG